MAPGDEHAGIVDQDVDVPEALCDFINHVGHVAGRRLVCLKHGGLHTGFDRFGNHHGRLVGGLAVGDGDGGP
jgi:hypothetical protein